MNTIPNISLKLAEIPEPEAGWGKIGTFGLTFNGYEYWGSFEACGEVANRCLKAFETNGSLPTTLTEARTSLFFEQRRWRHYGYLPDEAAMQYIQALVADIRAKVKGKKLD